MKVEAAGISKHFSREGKIMLGVFLAIVVLGLAAALIIPRLYPRSAQAACLEDDGTFDKETQTCTWPSK